MTEEDRYPDIDLAKSEILSAGRWVEQYARGPTANIHARLLRAYIYLGGDREEYEEVIDYE